MSLYSNNDTFGYKDMSFYMYVREQGTHIRYNSPIYMYMYIIKKVPSLYPYIFRESDVFSVKLKKICLRVSDWPIFNLRLV